MKNLLQNKGLSLPITGQAKPEEVIALFLHYADLHDNLGQELMGYVKGSKRQILPLIC